MRGRLSVGLQLPCQRSPPPQRPFQAVWQPILRRRYAGGHSRLVHHHQPPPRHTPDDRHHSSRMHSDSILTRSVLPSPPIPRPHLKQRGFWGGARNMVLELRQIFPGCGGGGGARYFATSRERAGREISLSIMCIDDSTIVLEGQAKGELGDARVHWEIRWGGTSWER